MSLLDCAAVITRIGDFLCFRDREHFRASDPRVAQALDATEEQYCRQRLVGSGLREGEEGLLLLECDTLTAFTNLTLKDTTRTWTTLVHLYTPLWEKVREEDDVDLEQLFGEGKMLSEQDKATILKNLEKFIKLDNADERVLCLMSERIAQIIKKFTVFKFEELVDNFHKEEYSIVALLIDTLNILGQEEHVLEFFQQENKFPLDFFPDTILDSGDQLDKEALSLVITDLADYFNGKLKIIHQCFRAYQVPTVMMAYTERVIEKDVINRFITRECDKQIDIVPPVYYQLVMVFVSKLNCDEEDKAMVVTFINMNFEPLIKEFLEGTVRNFEQRALEEIKKFQKQYEEQQKMEKDNIYKTLMDEYSTEDQAKTNKFELLTSFTKIFAKSNQNNEAEINFKLNLELINKNLQNLRNFINFELCTEIIAQAKSKVELVMTFQSIDHCILDHKTLNDEVELIFVKLITIIEQDHIYPGFKKADSILNRYDPLESMGTMNTVEPLVNFTELINIGDLIYQMLEIFYEKELVKRKVVDKNDFLTSANQAKKRFENTLDSLVAKGLNTGIDKLMDGEVEFIFNTQLLPNDYNPKGDAEPTIGPTKCAVKVVQLLSNHINLLNGSTEKGIIDVFQQEIGERFFQIIVKNIKKRQISTTGAIILISDLNLYYDFIQNTLKQKNITPLFAALKELGQLYLISSADSKELGKLIGDLTKFNGIFKQEEIYEFVTKRTDWLKVKKDVEKAMYGVCIIS